MAGPQSAPSAKPHNGREFILGVDLDGVVADYEGWFRDFVAARKGIAPHELPPLTQWSFAANGWFDTDEDYLVAHREAVNDHGMFAKLNPLEGVSDALWAMSDAGIRIRIVTHRLVVNFIHATAVRDTVSFLDLHRIPYRDICFVKDKADVGCDLYIDDAPHNIEALRAKHGPAVAMVYDQGYNRHLPGLRAYNWGDVVAEVSRRTGLDITVTPRN
jgi:5'-nucleotidase